jgi:hypothetical protein
VSLSAIRCNNNLLHLQRVDRRQKTKKERKKERKKEGKKERKKERKKKERKYNSTIALIPNFNHRPEIL